MRKKLIGATIASAAALVFAASTTLAFAQGKDKGSSVTSSEVKGVFKLAENGCPNGCPNKNRYRVHKKHKKHK